jgi:hypothetical protein
MLHPDSQRLLLEDVITFWAFNEMLENTGQANDPMELVVARQMALEKTGIFETCTPTMAWNYRFGDMSALLAERGAQISRFKDIPERQDLPRSRPKRVAAVAASDVWIGLSPRKRQKRMQ